MKKTLLVLLLGGMVASAGAFADDGRQRFGAIKSSLNKTSSVTGISHSSTVASGGWKSAVECGMVWIRRNVSIIDFSINKYKEGLGSLFRFY